MTFDEVLTQVLELLQRQGRVSYRALKVRFQLDDELLEAVKDELIYAQQRARDEDNRVLIWTEGTASAPPSPAPPPEPTSPPSTDQEREPLSYTPPTSPKKS